MCMFTILHPSFSRRHATLHANARGGWVTPAVSVARNLPSENSTVAEGAKTFTPKVSISLRWPERALNPSAYSRFAVAMDG